jgi:hypothetical protein
MSPRYDLSDALPPTIKTDGDWSRRELLRASSRIGLGLGLSHATGWVEASKCHPVRRRMVDVADGRFYVIDQGEGRAVLFCHGFPDTAATCSKRFHAVAETATGRRRLT